MPSLAMAEVVCSLRRALWRCRRHDELGPSTITFGQIEGGYRPYVVPDRAKVWVDMRLTPPTDTAAATRMVEQAIAVAEAAVPGCHGSYTVTGDRPAIERDPNSSLLAALKRAADDVTDADTTVGFYRLHRHRRHRGQDGQPQLYELWPRVARARAQAQRICAPRRYRSLSAGAHRARR